MENGHAHMYALCVSRAARFRPCNTGLAMGDPATPWADPVISFEIRKYVLVIMIALAIFITVF